MKNLAYSIIFFIGMSACTPTEENTQEPTVIEGNYKAPKAKSSIVIDASGSEKDWERAEWKELKHVWLGETPTPEDFSGRYKMLWDENFVYFLVEVRDDSLSDQHESPFDVWWDDDCLELFVDEDKSGGNHQFNHSAFAYHITLGLDVVDMDTNQKPVLFNDHLTAKWAKTGDNQYTWEVAMKVFDNSFAPGKENKPVVLTTGKKLGFAVSYNDNDGKFVRENFVGSVPIEGEGEERNKGWIDAGVFGTLTLTE